MKLLIYGIDGGDLEVMKKFPMPFLRRFLEENSSIDLTSDLINRGWAEILTGKGGHETGAFYMAPLLDGTHRCSTSFSMAKLEGRKDIKPMWDLFEENDLSYLIMNVPTTTPAPKVKKGIVVGSAGGGVNKIEGIPESLVSDPSIIPTLESHNYIVDIRIPNPDYEKTEEMLDDLAVMEERRTNCFIEICQSKNLDAGFLCNRGTTIIEYLARSEIESYEAYETMEEFMPGHSEKSWIHEKLEEHFAMLDRQFERLYNDLRPEHFIITADHGMVPHKSRANINCFLREKNFLKVKNCSGITTKLRRFKNKIGLGSASYRVMKRLPKAHDALAEFDWKKSLAFGHTFVPGIFINDSDRFGGPVTGKQIDGLVDRIVEEFNKVPESRKLGLVAKPYRRKFSGNHSEKLPDIKLSGIEGLYFDCGIKNLIESNPRYGPVPTNVAEVDANPFTGEKGERPVLVVDAETAKLVRETDDKDLRIVYELIKRMISK